MKFSILPRAIAWIIALTVFLSCFSAVGLADDTIPKPERSEPVTSEPETSEPETSEPETSEPETSEPGTSEPETSEPETSEPETSEPETSEPETSEPETSEPETSEPETSEPETSEPETSEPEASEPETSEPETSEPETSEPETSEPGSADPEVPVPEKSPRSGPGLYFGVLHSHTDISDGVCSVEDAFRNASQAEGLDFFAVTDNSSSFDNALSGQISADGASVSRDWAAGKTAAAAVTGPGFVGIYGYEMDWPSAMQVGHISTFGTPGFQSWEQEAYCAYPKALKNYYSALAAVPGSVSQFNHPGIRYGSFSSFGEYSEAADRAVSLLEIDFGEKDACAWFVQALDRGWHVAPTVSQINADGGWENHFPARTVVYARSLTEEDLYEAMGDCRVYATEDTDLEILYTMDGYFMGSRLERRHVGDNMDISVSLRDPTDGGPVLVEVITRRGKTAISQSLPEGSGKLSFSLSAATGYYFLRITQSDGDLAVTAPVWLDAEEELGISSLTCETEVPEENKEVVLNISLDNRETADFQVTGMELLADGVPMKKLDAAFRVPGGSSQTKRLSFACTCVGQTRITVKVSGTLEGQPRSYEASLMLSFRRSGEVTDILVDASHGNAGLDNMSVLRAMAAEKNIRIKACTQEMTRQELKNCRLLLVSAPKFPFSDTFLENVSEFAGYGGSVILCAGAEEKGSSFSPAAELNRLLEAMGSDMVIRTDRVRDPVTNGGTADVLYPDTVNRDNVWCDRVTEDQTYRLVSGCSIDSGSGIWLVKGHAAMQSAGGSSPVVLACGSLKGGGMVFAAGSLFLSDEDLKGSQNNWDIPYANRTIAENLLGISAEELPLRSIAAVRAAADGELVRIRGYVTAGTSNPHNRFPETIYLQDDTGGIAVIPFDAEGVQVGTPLEIVGTVDTEQGNRILKPGSWKKTDRLLYQYLPRRGDWETLLDLKRNGGRLVEVEGKCLEIYCREDGTMAGCLLQDDRGNPAKIWIEDGIFNGSDGKNVLQNSICKDRTVRAMGILYRNEYAETVLRVRNCEEVVYVPPKGYLNPRTGDAGITRAGAAMLVSFGCLLLTGRRKKK